MSTTGHRCEYPPDCPLTPEACASAVADLEVEHNPLASLAASVAKHDPSEIKPLPPNELDASVALDEEGSAGTTGRPRFYRHPQGAYITVYPDGSMDARNAAGNKKSTSATPEKLAGGHGAWREVAAL